jgi:hypothetical protein
MAEFENERFILAEIRTVVENIDNVLENIQELLGAIFINEQRNYDMLSIIADKLGADAKGLSFLHEQGKVLAPAPSFIAEDEQNIENE